MFWSLWIPLSTNKAIICIIRHSSSFPTGTFSPPNSTAIQLRSSFLSAAVAVIRRGTIMKQSSFPPTVKEPQDQLLCSSTAGVTPPSSVLSSLLSQMTWFVFLNRAFFVSLYNEYCNYWPEGLYSNKGNGWVGGCMRFQVEGNNTVWFPQGDDRVCARFNQYTLLWVLNWGSILYERGLLLKKSVMFMQLYFNYCEEKGYLEYITNSTRIEIKPLTYRFISCFQEQIFFFFKFFFLKVQLWLLAEKPHPLEIKPSICERQPIISKAA